MTSLSDNFTITKLYFVLDPLEQWEQELVLVCGQNCYPRTAGTADWWVPSDFW